ncbi:MAG TPA: BON domain-containing protein [Blastocatellia bacterium]
MSRAKTDREREQLEEEFTPRPSPRPIPREFGPGTYGEFYGEGLTSGTAFGPGGSLDYTSGFAAEAEAIRRYEEWRTRQSGQGPHAGKGPKGYVRPDESIREDVCERLLHDTHIDAREVVVTVENGEVTLEGTVADLIQKRRTDDACASVSGVKDVHNRLRVAPQGGSTA